MGNDFKDKRQRKVTVVLFGAYLLMLIWIVVFKLQIPGLMCPLPHIRGINLIPFYYSRENEIQLKHRLMFYQRSNHSAMGEQTTHNQYTDYNSNGCSRFHPKTPPSLCFIKLILTLLATRTFPVIRQSLKCYPVMLGRIIYIAADGTYIFSRCLFLGEIYLRQDSRNRIGQIHHTLCFKIFITLRCVFHNRPLDDCG